SSPRRARRRGSRRRLGGSASSRPRPATRPTSTSRHTASAPSGKRQRPSPDRAPVKTRVVNSRLRLLLLIIVLTFAALGARAAWLQTVRASSLARLAQKQAKFNLVLPAGRGTLFDRLGMPLAIGEQATDVIADPMQISDPRHEARVAAKVLGIP